MTYHRPTDHGAVCVHHHIASGCDRCGMMEEIGELMESRDAWKSGVRERQAEIDALEAERDRMREALDVIDGLLHECQPDAIYGANRELLNCRIAIKTARDIARAALAAEQTREPRDASGSDWTAPDRVTSPGANATSEAPTIHPPAPTREEPITPASVPFSSPSEEMPTTSDPAGNAGRGVCMSCRGRGFVGSAAWGDTSDCESCHGTGRAGEKPWNASAGTMTDNTPTPTGTKGIGTADASDGIATVPPSTQPSLDDRLWELTNQGMMGLNLARRASSLTMEWQRERAMEVVERMVKLDAPMVGDPWNSVTVSDFMALRHPVLWTATSYRDDLLAAILSVVLAVIQGGKA